MLRAEAANQDELFAEGLAGAVDADGGVADVDVLAPGEEFERGAGEVDFFEGLAVGGAKRRDDGGDAAAGDLLGLGVRFGRMEEFAGPLVEGAIFGGLAAVEVDDGVAEDAIEPGGDGLAVAEV